MSYSIIGFLLLIMTGWIQVIDHQQLFFHAWDITQWYVMLKKGWLEQKKVIKQMLSKKKCNFSLNKAVVCPGEWAPQCILSSRTREAFAHVHLPPGKQGTPLGSHELFSLLPSSVRYSMSSHKPVDCEVKIQPIFTCTLRLPSSTNLSWTLTTALASWFAQGEKNQELNRIAGAILRMPFRSSRNVFMWLFYRKLARRVTRNCEELPFL